MREAGLRGLRGNVVRPGYITDNPFTGIGPIDDFLLRTLKGSIQLSCHPDLGSNTINLVPVDYCANIVISSSLHPPLEQGVGVVHVTPCPQLAFNAFLETLQKFKYNAPMVPYSEWRSALEQYVSTEIQEQREPHALFPLFDWVTADLPSDTKSRTLENTNAQIVLMANGVDEKDCQVEVTQETVGAYLAFMCEIGFIGRPEGAEGMKLPVFRIGEEQREALKMVGRGEG
ncbi:MAG: large subunit of alpha-aminoadipate reductase [Alectoria sarmentosa]|nr:MAG: large subunit of alpha-aminoadipate reductase [Alectoria sarmentosa]